MSDAIAELNAMKAVAEAIEKLETEAKTRVLSWAADHYAVGKIKSFSQQSQDDDLLPVEAAESQQNLETIGDLFAQSQPGSDAERALVAGYWIQVEQGNTGFGTQEINRELKHLGYGVGNITRAFDTLKKTRPQQVIQLRKAGTSKQARRTFKLTDVGIKQVESMVRNRGNE